MEMEQNLTADAKQDKETIIQLLKDTNREGMDRVIEYMDKGGFFTAPASVNRHLNYDGGLMRHSLNVYKMAMMLREQAIGIRPEMEKKLPKQSIVIAALLHDFCKSNVYKKAQKWRKDAQGRWEQYDSYEVDYSKLPVGHGEKSVIMLLSLGLKLTIDEIVAIRWHMSAWEIAFQSSEQKSNISEASNKYPLTPILQAADQLATFIMET